MLNAHNVLIRIADTHHTVHTVHAITTQNETTQYCRSEHYPCSLQLPGGNSHGRNPKEITVNFDMFDKTPEEKTAEANKVAKSFGISDSALAEVEKYKAKLTRYNAWDLPFMGYVNEDGYGYAYVPDAAIVREPYWDAHRAFLALPEDVQVAFAIRMLFTHRPVDRYGASMFLHYQHGFKVNFIGEGANKY